MINLVDVQQYGQSLWLNYLRRAFIDSGQLREALDAGIRGITFNPTVFEKAITCSSDYDDLINKLVVQGLPVKQMYQALLVDDIQRAADVLRPIFEESGGRDGYVSVELNPALAYDTIGTIAECRHLLHEINRANVMVEIPATPAGVAAIESLTSDGVNVNATHIFCLDTYERVAQAYLVGIEKYVNTHSVWRRFPASVASVSLSRIDGAVDKALLALNRPDLRGWAGIALAKQIYRRFQDIFSGPDWTKLAGRGARVQRPKWTRTTPRSFNYPDTFYVDTLIGPDTVNTLSRASFVAFRDHGTLGATLADNIDVAEEHLDALTKLGISLNDIGRELQRQSLADFNGYFQALIASVAKKRDELENEWRRMVLQLGAEQTFINRSLEKTAEERLMCRIWDHDHTVWGPEPTEISNRLGWLHIVDIMQENLADLERFTRSLVDDGLTTAVILGMGGSSLAAELFGQVFIPWINLHTPAKPRLAVMVLDTTDPDAVDELAQRLDPARTLFVVSSKSGSTVETLSAFNFFYNWLAKDTGRDEAGGHFVAITDPGTSLAKLADAYRFRRLFLNDPNIGGRYSALSYFGLVPAVLGGVDLNLLLDRAQAMVCNAHSCNKGDNLAVQLGTTMGLLAGAGWDKLTLVTSPAIAPFGDWVEQLVAESTGKAGKGILPVVGETVSSPDVYGDDRLFVYLRLADDDTHETAIHDLAEDGRPLVTLQLKDIYDLGGMFFLWEMATAVAGHHLGINPFDQPNVEASKRLARQMVSAYAETGRLPEQPAAPLSAGALHDFLAKARPGDYIAIQAFFRPTEVVDAALRSFRTRLRDTTGLATTAGYGPRFLHATGQLHKGDRGNGLFIQLTAEPEVDLAIPDVAGEIDSSISFGALIKAQALGDAEALRAARRRLIHFVLGDDVSGGLAILSEAVEDRHPASIYE